MFRKTINSADCVKSDINFMHPVIKVSFDFFHIAYKLGAHFQISFMHSLK